MLLVMFEVCECVCVVCGVWCVVCGVWCVYRTTVPSPHQAAPANNTAITAMSYLFGLVISHHDTKTHTHTHIYTPTPNHQTTNHKWYIPCGNYWPSHGKARSMEVNQWSERGRSDQNWNTEPITCQPQEPNTSPQSPCLCLIHDHYHNVQAAEK